MKENPISRLSADLKRLAATIDNDIANNPLCDEKKYIIEFMLDLWPKLICTLTENLVAYVALSFPDDKIFKK